MSRYTVDLDYHTTERLIIRVLKEDLSALREDWRKVYVEKRGFFYSTDWEEDLRELSKIISALKEVLRFYGAKDPL